AEGAARADSARRTTDSRAIDYAGGADRQHDRERPRRHIQHGAPHSVAQRTRLSRLLSERIWEDDRGTVQRAAGSGSDGLHAAALERGRAQTRPGEVHFEKRSRADEEAERGSARADSHPAARSAFRAGETGGEAEVILERPPEAWAVY